MTYIQIIATEEALQETFDLAFEKALGKIVRPEIPKPEILDGDELIEKLGITRQTLARWRKQKRIPFIQAGAVIRYDLNKVLEALEKKKGGAR